MASRPRAGAEYIKRRRSMLDADAESSSGCLDRWQRGVRHRHRCSGGAAPVSCGKSEPGSASKGSSDMTMRLRQALAGVGVLAASVLGSGLAQAQELKIGIMTVLSGPQAVLGGQLR